VYVPASGEIKTAPLPVVLFIHGDSFNWGSGNLYDGSGLAAYGDVVVVTINYRLGVLGFLNVNSGISSGIPSNLGILDQIAALHWIQENIQDFGGDKGSVTVMGHGMGAACLHYLMTSDALPHGLLFHRVILMSGSALSPWARATSPHNTSRSLAAGLNCPTSPPHNTVRCLREASLESLLNMSKSIHSRRSLPQE
jgi:neuroligin